jgi:hypothetical protein
MTAAGSQATNVVSPLERVNVGIEGPRSARACVVLPALAIAHIRSFGLQLYRVSWTEIDRSGPGLKRNCEMCTWRGRKVAETV